MINEKGNEMHEKMNSPTLEVMQHFIDGAGQIYSPETQRSLSELKCNTLRCIDDRDSGSPEVIALPGAGLGVLIDLFGGLKLLGVDVDLQRVTDVFTAEFGLPSYHTDEHKRDESLCCAGCGHCSGALANPDAYLLNDQAVAFLDRYLPALAEQEDPTVYDGSHSAQATIIVEGTDAGLIANHDGTQVFVYQPDWHQLYLKKAAEAISREFSIDAASFAEKCIEAANNNLQVTVEKLAKDLPVYTMHTSGEQLVLSEG